MIRLKLFFIVCFVFLYPQILFSQQNNEVEKINKLSLEKVLKISINNYEKIKSAKANLELVEAQLREAKISPFTQFEITGFFAPTPERHGDAVHTAQQDTYFGGDWGIVTRVNIEGGIPINFARIWYLWQALDKGVNIAQLEIRRQKTELISQVAQSYYGLVLSRQMKNMFSEGMEYLQKAEDYVNQELEAESGEVTEIDRIKLNVYKEEVNARYSQVHQLSYLSSTALKLFTGIEFEPQEDMLNLINEDKIESLKIYINEGLNKRVETKMAKLAIEATEAELKMKKSEYIPELLLVGSFGYGYSDVVDNQANPFVDDPYNYLGVGFGLALQWNLDFGGISSRVKQTEAKLKQIKSDEKLTQKAIAADIEQEYYKLITNQQRADSLSRSQRYAKGWLVAVYQNLEAGLSEMRDLIDALVAYFTQSFNYYDALYQTNISWINFKLAVGNCEIEGTNYCE